MKPSTMKIDLADIAAVEQLRRKAAEGRDRPRPTLEQHALRPMRSASTPEAMIATHADGGADRSG